MEVVVYYLLFGDAIGGRMDFYERHPITNDATQLLVAYIDSLGNVRTDNQGLAMSATDPEDVARFVAMLTDALLNEATGDTT